MGIAYGAADDATSGNARRIGLIIGPDGRVKEYFPKVSAAGFPAEALQRI